MMNADKIGTFITSCRKEKNWTQKELGERLGVTDKAVSKWERGRSFPDISLLEPLCGLLEINVSELLAGQRLEPEEYKPQTEQMLIDTIDTKHLPGMQVCIYLLRDFMFLLFLLPFIRRDYAGLFPDLTVTNVLLWLVSLTLLCVSIYLDYTLPARQYRSSYLWLEVISVAVTYLILMGSDFVMSGGYQTMSEQPLQDQILIMTLFFICFVVVIAASAIRACRRRERFRQYLQ